MPQMMPINWLSYFFFFLIIYLLFNIMNYYIFSYKVIKNNKKINLINKNLNWKW
uniref:ATP synthase F0 subunit 8 n=1 Tax=Pareuchaetes insulata TaxID=1113308 RepID=UPI001FAEE4CD|nr:ATP synthase F0 subunit 8 [Pareuchaetes insulata]UNP49239.1 ATP synthase F0 subunit 8 [Pareuchaetes insulata]